MVGNSARDVLTGLPNGRSVVFQSVKTITDSRARNDRLLEAQPLLQTENTRYFVDDVIVSGNTMRTAMDAGQFNENDQVIAGLAFNSRSMRTRINAPMRAVVTYDQEQGGVPAMNSLSTLAQNPELAASYRQRKTINPMLLSGALKIYRGML